MSGQRTRSTHTTSRSCPTPPGTTSRGALTPQRFEVRQAERALSAPGGERGSRRVVLQRLPHRASTTDSVQSSRGSSERFRETPATPVKAFIPDIERRARDPLGVLQVTSCELATTPPETVVTARSTFETQAQILAGWGSPSVRRGHCANGGRNPAILKNGDALTAAKRGFVFTPHLSASMAAGF